MCRWGGRFDGGVGGAGDDGAVIMDLTKVGILQSARPASAGDVSVCSVCADCCQSGIVPG